MRLRKARRAYGAELNMTPMIDIVFQLVIFFMLVSQVPRMEMENVTLPEAAQGEEPRAAPPGRVVINVLPDERYFVAGRMHTLASVEGLLAQEAGARPAADVAVLVRSDRGTPWKAVGRVLRACAARGIHKVKVAVVEPEGSPAAS